MDKLETKSVVRKLNIGECPKCFNKLVYCMRGTTVGYLDKNGMAYNTTELSSKGFVVCPICGYNNAAIQIGLKIIPTDRIVESNENWEDKYIEDNTLVWGEEGKNPFNKD